MKKLLLSVCALLISVAGFTQELIKNGNFELPADGKNYATIDSIPNWKTEDHRTGANMRVVSGGNAVCNQWDEAGSFYQVVGVVPADETTFAVNYKLACTYSYWAGWKVPVYVIFSSFSGDDPATRMPIDSIKNEFYTASANYGKDSTINEQFVLHAGNAHVGEHLVIEFKQKNSQDYGWGSSWTYLNYDDISVVASGGNVVVEEPSGTELLTNGDFSLPDDSIEHKNLNNIPAWKTDTQSEDYNGRSYANEGPRKKDAVAWLWDETPGVYQVIGDVPAVATRYDVNFDLSCSYTWWSDYKSDFFVIFSSYSGDDPTKRTPLDSIKWTFDCKSADWFNFTAETGSYYIPAGNAHAGEHLVVEFKPFNSEDFGWGHSYTYFWLDNASVKSTIVTGTIENKISSDAKIIAYAHQIRIEGVSKIKSVSVYDLMGRKIMTVKPERNIINVSQLSGFYIVVVDSDAGKKAQKVIF